MKKKFRNFKLRMMLFRIWFVKNIFLWLQIIGVTLLICVLTGAITESTPVLGPVVYPIFSPLIDNVTTMIKEKEIGSFVNIVRILVMFLYSIGLFVVKVKTLAREDIKSRKQKIAIIQGNLYFDDENRLRKKTNSTSTELNLPTSDDSPKLNTGLISGTINAIHELGIIMTADFSGTDEEAQAAYDKAIEDAECQDAAEIAESLSEDTKDIMEEVALEELVKINSDETLSEEEKKERFNIFKWIFHLFKKDKVIEVKDEEDETDDNVIIDNDVEIDSEESTNEPVVEEVTESKTPEVQTTILVTQNETKESVIDSDPNTEPVINLGTNTTSTKSSSDNTVNDFISRLQNK